ncbi:MAG: DUF58 domain-containing protein [Planctomycetota bacterium]
MKPTRRCLLLFGLGFGAALLPVFAGPALWPLWLAYVALPLLLTGADPILGLPARALDVAVTLPPRIYIGERDVATVALAAPRGPRTTTIEVLADLDEGLVPQPMRSVALVAGGQTTLPVPLVPLRRGRFAVQRLWLRWTGPLGLMARVRIQPVEGAVGVVPNPRPPRGAALRLLRRDARVGLKVIRHVGEGSEFESLREYVPGLDARALDWKASARHRKLVVQEYRPERNHQIILAIDTGHLMREPLGGIPKLDHAINATLLLARVCLRTGDRVGTYAFDAKARAFAEPRGGVRTFARLQRLTADLEYSTAETNFTLGLAQLSGRLHRRSFIVLLTDFVDTVTAELMVENVGRLARRHLVTFVTLRDPGLEETIAAPPTSRGSLYRTVVSDGFAQERDLVLRRLGSLGIFCIDAPPHLVSTELLNRYLDVKRRELI